jgi:large subunit ribosomal protein L15e
MGFTKLTRNISIQRNGELKASTKYPNCEVLNSYNVGEDGNYKYFEVILVSKNQPEVQKDKTLKNVINKDGRAERGLTSAGKKGRGLVKVKQTTKK